MKTRFFHNFLTDFEFPYFECLPIVCQKDLKRSNRIAASQKIRNSFCHCFFRFYQYMTVGIRCYHIAVMTQPLLHLLERCSIFAQQRSTRMPLRYNYDKPEKPRRIKGFEVFSLVFSSFSKPKNHTEISRIIGGVSLTTNE